MRPVVHPLHEGRVLMSPEPSEVGHCSETRLVGEEITILWNWIIDLMLDLRTPWPRERWLPFLCRTGSNVKSLCTTDGWVEVQWIFKGFFSILRAEHKRLEWRGENRMFCSLLCCVFIWFTYMYFSVFSLCENGSVNDFFTRLGMEKQEMITPDPVEGISHHKSEGNLYT